MVWHCSIGGAAVVLLHIGGGILLLLCIHIRGYVYKGSVRGCVATFNARSREHIYSMWFGLRHHLSGVPLLVRVKPTIY